MYRKPVFSILVLLLNSYFAMPQAIDNALSFKNINRDRYIRFNYENDVFSGSDIYYTQGMHLELVAPWVKRFPISRLLIKPDFGYVRYAISVEHNGYTPTSISDESILYGDRPFTACLFLKTAVYAVDPIKRRRWSTSISLGVMGQAAGGEEMQVGIHKALNNITPHGWANQIHNDVILNYQADYEHQLIRVNRAFSIDIDGMARLGTLSDKISAGGTIMAGYFDDPFSGNVASGRNFRIYAYEHPEVDFVGYDATLQGGLFNRSSPYTISSNDITRVTFQNRFGFVVIWQGFYLEYFQSFESCEFKTGDYHVWGGVQLAFAL